MSEKEGDSDIAETTKDSGRAQWTNVLCALVPPESMDVVGVEEVRGEEAAVELQGFLCAWRL